MIDEKLQMVVDERKNTKNVEKVFRNAVAEEIEDFGYDVLFVEQASIYKEFMVAIEEKCVYTGDFEQFRNLFDGYDIESVYIKNKGSLKVYFKSDNLE